MRYGFFCKIPFVERNTELPQYLIKQKKPRSIRGFLDQKLSIFFYLLGGV